MDLIEGQMIIEYTGEVVRPCLTDKRERENERKVCLKKKRMSNREFFMFDYRVLVVICLQLIQ
jgi:hypothetical protein